MKKCPKVFDFSMFPPSDANGVLGRIIDTDLKEVDIAFCTIPYEAGKETIKGTIYAADYLRSVVYYFNSWSDLDLDIDIEGALKIRDYGVFQIQNDNSNVESQIEEQYKALLEYDTYLIAIGGDQAILKPQLRALKNKYGKIALVHFGATLYDEILESVEEGLIDSSHSLEIGTRNGFGNGRVECANVLGLNFITASNLANLDKKAIINKIRETIGELPVFISFDMNFFDPSYAPGVGNPVAGGFKISDAQIIIEKSFIEKNIVGADLVDMVPALDNNEVTANGATEVIHKLMSVAAYNIQLKQNLN